MRELNQTTIKPVIRFLSGWGNSLYSLNTRGADFYHFTLDMYEGKNSFQGGFAWGLDDCYGLDNKPFNKYALDIKTGKVYDLENKKIIIEGV